MRVKTVDFYMSDIMKDIMIRLVTARFTDRYRLLSVLLTNRYRLQSIPITNIYQLLSVPITDRYRLPGALLDIDC